MLYIMENNKIKTKKSTSKALDFIKSQSKLENIPIQVYDKTNGILYIVDYSNNKNEITMYLQNKLNFEQALQVAKDDTEIGVIIGIERLESYGFDTSVFYEYLKGTKLEDTDYIQARDYLFKSLKIENIMSQAYEAVCE